MKEQNKLTILIGIFISSLIGANLLGNKIAVLCGISFSVGIFAYPITFLITDIIEEVKGKKYVNGIILSGFISLLLILFLTKLSIMLPPAPRFQYNDEYIKIFNTSSRIIIASIIAFIISQFHDVFTFEYIKKKTKSKYLWLRNNVSTIISQLIDTTLFMFIAFYHITPKFDFGFIISLILPYWGLKVIMAIIDTPFVYIGVKWLKDK
jgi:uncharacterized integral membrane protein (TIGR00697 family)